MVAFGHTAVGTAVGLATFYTFGHSDPVLGLLAAGTFGIVSHYVCDFIPHGHFFHHNDFKKKIIWAIVFDLFLSVVLFSFLAYLNYGLSVKFWYILFGIGGAQLPDVLDGFYYIGWIPKKGFLKIENDFHQSTHWHAIYKNGKLVTGLPIGRRDVWQVTSVVVALLLVAWR